MPILKKKTGFFCPVFFKMLFPFGLFFFGDPPFPRKSLMGLEGKINFAGILGEINLGGVGFFFFKFFSEKKKDKVFFFLNCPSWKKLPKPKIKEKKSRWFPKALKTLGGFEVGQKEKANYWFFNSDGGLPPLGGWAKSGGI